jgi:hypothetical protein
MASPLPRSPPWPALSPGRHHGQPSAQVATMASPRPRSPPWPGYRDPAATMASPLPRSPPWPARQEKTAAYRTLCRHRGQPSAQVATMASPQPRSPPWPALGPGRHRGQPSAQVATMASPLPRSPPWPALSPGRHRGQPSAQVATVASPQPRSPPWSALSPGRHRGQATAIRPPRCAHRRPADRGARLTVIRGHPVPLGTCTGLYGAASGRLRLTHGQTGPFRHRDERAAAQSPDRPPYDRLYRQHLALTVCQIAQANDHRDEHFALEANRVDNS